MQKQPIKSQIYNRGDIFYADLGVTLGSEQGGIRPVIIIQNDVGNFYSPTVIVSAITSKTTKKGIPTHKKVGNSKLRDESIILLEQIRTIDKKRIKDYICSLNKEEMKNVDKALMLSLGLVG